MSIRSSLRAAVRTLGLSTLARSILTSSQETPRLPVATGLSIPNRYLAITAIFKNEAAYVAEWVEFHRMVGVEHVYLYDNGSGDNPTAVLQPFVDQGFVTLIPWALPWRIGGLTAQMVAYAHALMNFGQDWRWMAFIDLDEFLFPTQGDSLSAVLRQYEDLPALAAFWRMFAFSGHDKMPAGLVIENYTKQAPYPYHARPKSIVNPADVVAVGSPHLFDLTSGPNRVYTESRQLFSKDAVVHGAPESNMLRLNHYYTRSREEFTGKLDRTRAAQRPWEKVQKLAEMIDAVAEHDDTIIRFVPELKKRMSAVAAAGSELTARKPSGSSQPRST